MTAMIMLGDRCGGDPQRIAIAQSLRIVLVVLFLPPLFWAFEGGEGTLGPADAALTDGWLLLAIPLLLPLGKWLRLPSPALLAPLLATALLSGLDIASLALPSRGMNLMLWVLGSAIGSRFQGMTRRLLGRYLWQSDCDAAGPRRVGCFCRTDPPNRWRATRCGALGAGPWRYW